MGMMIDNGFEDTESCILPTWFTPSDKDVVCGWARQYQGHAGNERFRKLVEYSAPHYLAAATKLQKTQVIAAVVDKVRRDSPHGGFVKLNVTTGRWYEIGDDRARDKVGHAIRRFLDYKPHRGESLTSKKPHDKNAKRSPAKGRTGRRSTSRGNQAAIASLITLPSFDKNSALDGKTVDRDMYAVRKGEAISTNNGALILPPIAGGAQSCPGEHRIHQGGGNHQSTLSDKLLYNVMLGPSSEDVIRSANNVEDMKIKASVAADSLLHFPALSGHTIMVEQVEETKGIGGAFAISWTKNQGESRGGGGGESLLQGQRSFNCCGYNDLSKLLPVKGQRNQQGVTFGGSGEGNCSLPTSRVISSATTTQDQAAAVRFCNNALHFGGSMGVGTSQPPTTLAPHSHQLNTLPTFPLSSTPGMPSSSSCSSSREAQPPSLMENSMLLSDIFLQQQEQQQHQQDALRTMLGRFEHDEQALIQELERLRDHSLGFPAIFTRNRVDDHRGDASPPSF